MADEGRVALKPKKRPQVRAEHYRDIYANACVVSVGHYDFNILFNQVKELDGEQVAESQTKVYLSPQQFKALTLVCVNSLEAYEKVFGEQKLPPHFKPRADLVELLAASVSLRSEDTSTEKKRPSKRSRDVSLD
jgi:hypothetical protein